jgi:hypothetical protein
MSGSVSLAPTNDRHDSDPWIRFAVLSRIEIFHYPIRTPLRFSAQPERGLSSPTSSATASREKPGSAQSAPTVPAAGCRRRIGCTPHCEGSGQPPVDGPRRRRSWQGPPAGRAEAVSQVPYWRQQRQTVHVGLATVPSGRLPVDQSHRRRRLGWFSPGRTLVAGAGISPCGCGTWPLI